MNTFGQWASRRAAHNTYGALLSEGGLGTTLATLGLVFAIAGRVRARRGAKLEVGVILAYLVAGFGGASPYQFAFAALVAISTKRRAGLVLED